MGNSSALSDDYKGVMSNSFVVSTDYKRGDERLIYGFNCLQRGEEDANIAMNLYQKPCCKFVIIAHYTS